jgi:nitrate/nitrite transport system substrate-binding protein
MNQAGADQGPADGYRKFTIMGREYDPANPQRYLDGFAIKRS